MTERHPTAPTLPPASPSPQVVYREEPVNWREHWQVLVEQKKLIGIITAVSTILALLAAFLITPIYRAEVLLAPVTEEKTGALGALAGQFGDLAALTGVSLGNSKDKSAEAIAALKSRSLATAFFKEANVLPVLFPREWDAEKKAWKDKDDAPTDWEAYEEFDEDIRFVSVDRKTGLVTLMIEWKDPIRAAQWANKFVNMANTRLRTEAVEDAEKSISYLEKQLRVSGEVEIQQSIYRLIEAQTKKRMVANTREEYAFKVIDPAVVPEKKVRPKRALIVLFGLMLGAMAGVITAFTLVRIATRRTAGM
jgi:uncharacterized protein involved in exopolysaccharide biosynthesis